MSADIPAQRWTWLTGTAGDEDDPAADRRGERSHPVPEPECDGTGHMAADGGELADDEPGNPHADGSEPPGPDPEDPGPNEGVDDHESPAEPGGQPPAVPPGRFSPERTTGTFGRNLPLAIASGVGLAVVTVGTLFLSAWAFLAFVMLIIGVALHELDAAMRTKGVRPATPVAFVAGAVMFFGAYLAGSAGQSIGLVVLVIGALAWVLLDPRIAVMSLPEHGGPAARDESAMQPLRGGPVSTSLGTTLLMGVWVPFLASFIGLLLARPEGAWVVLYVLILAVVSDVGAFAVGSKYGRRRLAPRVSPGKSWEGFGGGLGLTAVVGLALSFLPPLALGPFAGLAMGAGICLAATIGDLAESMVKRDLGLKDLGRILPGHGGIMDRVDALLFALPVGHLVLAAFGH